MRRPVLRVSNQVRHKPAVQLQKMARFEISDLGLYYLCSENKSADQLSGSENFVFA